MKSNKLLSFIIVFIGLAYMMPANVQAQANGNGGNLGFGVILGEPTGLSIKSWNNERSAFDVGAAWSFSGSNDALHLQADYLLHNWFNNIEGGPLAFYYGIGARALLGDHSTIGVRIPIGLNYVIPNSKLDLFLEAAPILDLAPDTDFAGNGGLGIRYYF